MKKLLVTFASATVIFLTGCQTPTGRNSAGTWRSSDFEDRTTDGWVGKYGTTLTITRDHATHSRWAMAAVLPGSSNYPGVEREFATPQDWSDYAAFRFHVFNAESHDITVSVRVDDTGSHDVRTRYNNDINIPHRLAPGDNEVEVSILALRQGSFLARGLDVDRIAKVTIFTGRLKEPAKLIFDDFQLVRGDRKSPTWQSLIDLTAKGPARWSASNGGDARLVLTLSNTTALAFTMNSGTPRLGFSPVVTNWLGYDWLHLAFDCDSDIELPWFSVKVSDATGRKQTVSLHIPAKPGHNEIDIPLDIFSEVALGRVAEIALFTGEPAKPQTITLTAMGLQRLPSVSFPPVRDAATTNAVLTLDCSHFRFTGAQEASRNTAYLAQIRIPLRDGRTRVVRCNSEGLTTRRYTLPPEAFQNYLPNAPIQIGLYMSDHGVWFYWTRTVHFNDTPITVTFDKTNADP